MTKYIPGNPNFIVQNMPGASSMIAANHVYTVGKPDGLTLGSISPALYLPKLFEQTLGLRFSIISGYQGGHPMVGPAGIPTDRLNASERR